ncbi:MAG: polysaccharide deacetylase family protein [Chthoniobacteraceae bacterium]
MSSALPIPRGLVVLTFDDAVSNHATFVGPLLKRHGFGATFYVCEFPPDFETNKEQYMTWEQIKSLSDAGFEIGNHTGHHASVPSLSPSALGDEIEYIERRCGEYGIPRPSTFCYPGCGVSESALPILAGRGYRFARIGSDRAYDPATDSPLLVPSFGCHGDDPEVFYRAVEQARDNRIVVLMFHGVPEYTHPWVHTDPEHFEQYMDYLAREKYTVIAMRDLARYVE